eukprot:TRINITY_DN5976_c0_g1_i2.p1 TRINITY_DN5976_c0_g1~~TRINITY_DN5976_c0_g1_i2.p1  ORF type:complete len:353 (-),score=54.97 TRINITY_DN5976_c0_g1_i2:13-1071(-)
MPCNPRINHMDSPFLKIEMQDRFIVESAEWILHQPAFSLQNQNEVNNRTFYIPTSVEGQTLECLHYPASNHSRNLRVPPFLLVHGAFHAAWCFGILQQYLQEQGVDSYAISLRDHGSSYKSKIQKGVTLMDLANDVESAVRYLFVNEGGVVPYVLLGHSVGGAVVQRFVSNQWSGSESKELLPSCLLLLYSFSALAPQTTWLSNWFHRHHRATIKSLITANPKAVFDSAELVRDGFYTKSTPESIVKATYAKLENNESPLIMMDLSFHKVVEGGKETARKLGTSESSRLMNRIIVFGASEDNLITKEVWEDTADAYGTTAVVIQGGHNGFLDLNWKHVCEKVFGQVIEIFGY